MELPYEVATPLLDIYKQESTFYYRDPGIFMVVKH